MVCLCGHTIYRNLETLFCPQSRTIPYHRWQRFPAEWLYGEISLYNAFHSMIQSLSRAEASSSVNLLRSRFAGFLGIDTDRRESEGGCRQLDIRRCIGKTETCHSVLPNGFASGGRIDPKPAHSNECSFISPPSRRHRGCRRFARTH